MTTDSRAVERSEKRKKDHLKICIEDDTYQIEDSGQSGYDDITLIHHALPDLSFDSLDTSLTFLDYDITYPFFISCMTGGFNKAKRLNHELAKAAQHLGIPVGTGSIRALFRYPDLFADFHLKSLTPDVPVISNLGVTQLKEIPHVTIYEMLKKLEVQAIAIHLNPGEELVQPEGDKDFTGLMDAFARFAENCPCQVIVKETGCGIKPSLVEDMLKFGADFVDLAGGGGTNWMLVESYRQIPVERDIAREFDSWGLPTALIQAVLGRDNKRIIASGGIRTGLDIAKSVVMGAQLAGLALPFIRAVYGNGFDGAVELGNKLAKALKMVMFLTGSRNLEQLRAAPFLMEESFKSKVEQLTFIEGIQS